MMNIATLLAYAIAVLIALFVNRPVMRRMLVIGFVWTIICVVTGWHWFFIGHSVAIGYGFMKVGK